MLLAVPVLLGVLLISRAANGLSTFQSLSIAAVIVGVAVAVGDPRRGRAHRATPVRDGHIADLAQSTLATLDPVEHRRLELGEPWPQLVVGPTGVSIIDVCRMDAAHTTPAGDDGARVTGCVRCGEMAAVWSAVRRLLAELSGGPSIPVRAVSVVAPGTPDATSDDATVAVIPADVLRDTIVRGPVLPMSTVDEVFGFLTQRATGSWVRRL